MRVAMSRMSTGSPFGSGSFPTLKTRQGDPEATPNGHCLGTFQMYGFLIITWLDEESVSDPLRSMNCHFYPNFCHVLLYSQITYSPAPDTLLTLARWKKSRRGICAASRACMVLLSTEFRSHLTSVLASLAA
jgi:hypothetical protein